MIIKDKTWNKYISVLRELDNKAAEEMIRYMSRNDLVTISETLGSKGYFLSRAEREALIDYAYGLATKYGEAAGAAACEMYDAVALLQGANVPPAMPARTATYGETAKAINGTLKQSPEIVPQAVSRLVKTAGVDTTMQNAIRDGAYWAWIPQGDTCAFCIMLASNGWQKASPSEMEGDHAAHIHANCDCTYAVRFGNNLDVGGYDPDEYRKLYDDADGSGWQEKLNSMRRDIYAKNADEINAQKRSAYEKRKERESSAAEELDV